MLRQTCRWEVAGREAGRAARISSFNSLCHSGPARCLCAPELEGSAACLHALFSIVAGSRKAR